jgi:hypothetical protein
MKAAEIAAMIVLLVTQPCMAQVDVDENNEFDGIDESATEPDDVPGDPDAAIGHDVFIQVVIRAWGRLGNGTIFTPVVAKQSPVGDTPNLGMVCTRWGDYFDVELDPDDGSFRATGMYMKQGGEDPELWGTWIFRFTVD